MLEPPTARERPTGPGLVLTPMPGSRIATVLVTGTATATQRERGRMEMAG
jgi:hypothetical protein